MEPVVRCVAPADQLERPLAGESLPRCSEVVLLVDGIVPVVRRAARLPNPNPGGVEVALEVEAAVAILGDLENRGLIVGALRAGEC